LYAFHYCLSIFSRKILPIFRLADCAFPVQPVMFGMGGQDLEQRGQLMVGACAVRNNEMSNRFEQLRVFIHSMRQQQAKRVCWIPFERSDDHRLGVHHGGAFEMDGSFRQPQPSLVGVRFMTVDLNVRV
jgi:hypothetical protein